MKRHPAIVVKAIAAAVVIALLFSLTGCFKDEPRYSPPQLKYKEGDIMRHCVSGQRVMIVAVGPGIGWHY